MRDNMFCTWSIAAKMKGVQPGAKLTLINCSAVSYFTPSYTKVHFISLPYILSVTNKSDFKVSVEIKMPILHIIHPVKIAF